MKRDIDHLTRLLAAMQQSGAEIPRGGLADAARIWRLAGRNARESSALRATVAMVGRAPPPPPALAASWALSGVDAPAPDGAASGARTAWIAAAPRGVVPAPFTAELIAAAPDDADVVVTDDLICDGGAWRLRLKPAFDELLASASGYLGHAAFFRPGTLGEDGAAALAAGAPAAALIAARPAARVAHLPYPAVIDGSSVAARVSQPAARHLSRSGLISVVIPNRDSPKLIATALEGVLNDRSGPEIEIIVVDNGSTDPETLAVYRRWRADRRFRLDLRPAPFNFSALVNRGAALARGEAILLLNNDMEVIEPGWLARMAETLVAPGVGIVGARLLFPDRTIQHMGVIVGHGGVAGHERKGMAVDAPDPIGRARAPHLREAVTAAAMLVRREVWSALGGFDEAAFPVAFNDVDFCLRAGRAGWRVALDPRATLIHHEGASRRTGVSPRRFLAHRRERAALRARHATIGRIDRFESPWRDPDLTAPTFRMLDAIPAMRL